MVAKRAIMIRNRMGQWASRRTTWRDGEDSECGPHQAHTSQNVAAATDKGGTTEARSGRDTRPRPRVSPHHRPVPGRGDRRVALEALGRPVTEGFVRGGVHASYLHTHWNGILGAAIRFTAAARAYREARSHD